MFELKTPQDLLKKATHDLGRLRANHLDTYAAFDFFVSARNIPYWLYPDSLDRDATKRNSSTREALFKQHVELRVCRHLAEGAKHFFLNDSSHKQVQDTVRTYNPWGKSWAAGSWEGWGTDELVIHLDPRDPDTSILGSQIGALDLAEKVLAILEKAVP